MFKDKRGTELTISTLIGLIIAVLVLVVIILILTGAFGDIGKQIMGKIKWAFGLWPKTTSP